MNLTAHQQRQAETQMAETSQQVDSLIAETFTLVLTPSQQPGISDIEWQTTRVATAGDFAARVSRKFASKEKLINTYSGVRIRMDLDRRGLWSERGDIAVHKLWDTYARFLHMPRLANRETLNQAIANRATNLTWQQETFAYAQAHDGEIWVGLHTDEAVFPAPSGLPIRPDRVPEHVEPPEPPPGDPPGGTGHLPDPSGGDPVPGLQSVQPTAFYTQFELEPLRCVQHFYEIVENVSGKLRASDVELILEIRATNHQGFNESTQRTVSENACNLKAQSSEFE